MVKLIDLNGILIRQFEPADAEGVIKLHKLVGWPISNKIFDYWLKYKKYSKVLVAVIAVSYTHLTLPTILLV